MAPSDSITARPGPPRSVAPTMATERGLTSGSSRMRSPLPDEKRNQHAGEYGSRQQRGYHREHRIGFQSDALEHFLRQRRSVAAGDEDRNHGLVERMQKGKQCADQDAGPQHRQRHPPEG